MLENEPDPVGLEVPESYSSGHDWRLGRFPDLMPRRVEEILLVSSPYDSFILEEDGLLTELIFSEYMDLGLTHAPHVTRVASGEQALKAIREGRFDLVITMQRLADMNVEKFAPAVHMLDPILPVVLLIANEMELVRLGDRRPNVGFHDIFVWHGDAKLFLAIIKVIEDQWNAESDTRNGGVGVIILVEDSVRFRSSLLPIMYSELVSQTRSVMLEGLNRMHRLLRMKARPKILVADNFERAAALHEKFRDYLFGVICDVSFEHEGQQDPRAGLSFVRLVKQDNPDTPALLQSSDPANRQVADEAGVPFLHKRSATLLRDVHQFMLSNFGFGDFIFRRPDGSEVTRAADLRSMVRALSQAPLESVEYHARRNHFSNWLRARTEFVLARRLRPRRVSEFQDIEALRRYLIGAVEEALRQNRRGLVEDFSRPHFDATTRFARIGGGSLGGKARGLAFMDALLARQQLDRAFESVRVYVPRSVVIGTDVFDRFLEDNGLRGATLYNAADDWITSAFLKARLANTVVEDLRAFLRIARYPLAVRSSSLLEDSQYYPFAGVYATHMLANNHADDDVRLTQLCDAIKLVYASTFYSGARKYLEATPHRIEEQKMGVILQQIVGSRYDQHFYPSFAGVVRSYNFYPFGHMRPEDGVAFVALGLGQLVVEGGEALRFCPAHPQVLPQLAQGKQFLDRSQRGFFAIDLAAPERGPNPSERSSVVRLDLEDAERHGTLQPIASVWSHENQCYYDGIYRQGVRVVTFAHVLKSGLFPLAPILDRLRELGREGMGGPVEIEFAVNLKAEPREFAVLQIRPFGAAHDYEPVRMEDISHERAVCYSEQALGHGVIQGIRDIVYVKPERFDAARTQQIAREVADLNDNLKSAGRTCVLIGPGRWGSSNCWLGIPVAWAQISEARVIIETSLDQFAVDPSQGSHFFHNLTSLGVAYLTINPRVDRGFVNWEWLDSLDAVADTDYVRQVRAPDPLEVRIDGRSSRAEILKCARAAASAAQ